MKRKFSAQPRWTPYLFLAPFLAVFGVFMIYPLLQSVVLSTEQTFGPEFTEFVGLGNFRNLLNDPVFFAALQNMDKDLLDAAKVDGAGP